MWNVSSAFQPLKILICSLKIHGYSSLALNVWQVASWRAMHCSHTDSIVLQQRPLTSYLLDLPSNSLNFASKLKAHLFFKVLSHQLAVTALVLAKQIWLPQCHTGHAHGMNWRTSQSLAFTMLDHLAIVMMTWRFRQTHLFTQAYKTEGNSSWDSNTDKLELSKWLSNGPSKRPFHFLSKAKT